MFGTMVGAPSLSALAHGSRVGTASLRRAAQLLALRDDLRVVAVRGNVDTRLRKLQEGACDAIVLAAAGLRRLGREDAIGCLLEQVVPAAGQGALVVEGRAGARLHIDDAQARRTLSAERALVRMLGADCRTPVGAHLGRDGVLRAFVGAVDGSAWLVDELAGRGPGELGADCRSALGVHAEGSRVRAFVGAVDGSKWITDSVEGEEGSAELAARLLAVGAGELLRG